MRCAVRSHPIELFAMKLGPTFSLGLSTTACQCIFGAALVGALDDLTHRIQTRLPLCHG